jgi:hypothetical protein
LPQRKQAEIIVKRQEKILINIAMLGRGISAHLCNDTNFRFKGGRTGAGKRDMQN